ncbi:MAG: SMC-Scp complex subunit ScpB [Clostridia bacterium]|nr:SMC-Scp complex subunit ScpB [Clostridia bacterium]
MNPLLPMVEALLFASEEPVGARRLAELCGADEPAVREALRALERARARPESGIQLELVAGGYRLVTKPEFAELVAKLKGSRPPALSPAALETLAIVLYRQPVTRAEIDELRGVSSESALGTLLERGLVREVGRRKTAGRPVLYGTTKKTLVALGVRDVRELPDPGALLSREGPRQLYFRVPEGAPGQRRGHSPAAPPEA